MEQAVREQKSAVTLAEEETLQKLAFFQMVQYIQHTAKESPRPGELGPFSQEAVRFRANASLAFPRADVESLDVHADSQMPAYLMTVNFLGLYGPSSPLPAFYTEDLLYYTEEENTTRHFLDLFHHRMVSYIYRCWEKYRFENTYRKGASDRFSGHMLALLGIDPVHVQRDKPGLDIDQLLSQINVVHNSRGSKGDVLRAIRQFFGEIPCQLEENLPLRLPLEHGQLNQLGKRNVSLGQEFILGGSLTDVSSGFRISIGPLGFDRFSGFLPEQQSARALHQLLSQLIDAPLMYELDVMVFSEDIPPLQLGGRDPLRLGWSSWLGKPKEPYDTVRYKNKQL